MTQRYMHLSPDALDSAIRLLDQPLAVQSFGDILETGRVSEGKINANPYIYSGTAIRFFFPAAGSRSSAHTRPPAV